jgi:coenzyme F420-reducing hydrogenase beta subunit
MKKLIFIAFMPLLLMHCGISYNICSPYGMSETIINTTTGQELIDLQQALDSGVINQEEYDELKLKIIKRLDVPVDSTKSK